MKKKTEAKESSKKISFEESMQNLEEIVRKLESGSPTLDDSIKMFEEGVRYTNICNEYLKDAKMKVEMLTKTDSEFEIEDF
ncbi:MAG: exodeoxyribonuclease VII small subunit [Methanosarcinales archaeon]|nr:exodeoxyribonuclease VII small subunit [Methanosarcinales archaeon]